MAWRKVNQPTVNHLNMYQILMSIFSRMKIIKVLWRIYKTTGVEVDKVNSRVDVHVTFDHKSIMENLQNKRSRSR